MFVMSATSVPANFTLPCLNLNDFKLDGVSSAKVPPVASSLPTKETSNLR